MKGYKVFHADFTCRDFQYEVGKTFHHEGGVSPCESGFHFCIEPSDCFQYYLFDSNNIVCEVEASDVIIHHGNKSVTNTLTIVRQLSWYEVQDLVNTGKGNTGYANSGHHNSGRHNTGHYNAGRHNSGHQNTGDNNAGNYNSGTHNSGDKNSGYNNTGYLNSGDKNSGNYNTGNSNSGLHNSGDYNSGNYNSGDYNSGDFSSGVFNTRESEIHIFNKPSNLTLNQWKCTKAYEILSGLKPVVYEGGVLRGIPYKDAWANLWCGLTVEEKTIIQGIPNFDKDIFFEITGIEIK
jgi:hypothetical protein